MRKDVREFIRRLEAVGLTVEPTPGYYRRCATASRSAKPDAVHAAVLARHDPLARSADTVRRSSSRASSASTCSKKRREMPKPADLSVTGLRPRHVRIRTCTCQAAAAALLPEESARGPSTGRQSGDEATA
jgi:hypothetical protein